MTLPSRSRPAGGDLGRRAGLVRLDHIAAGRVGIPLADWVVVVTIAGVSDETVLGSIVDSISLAKVA